MIRLVAAVFTLSAFALLLSGGASVEAVQAKKAQMVKGNIKEVQTDKDVLIVNQKVKNEFVDRELSIVDTTEFIVTKGGTTQKANGSAGLRLIENAKGASVQVKCDKDVNVLQVKVTIK